MFSFSSVSSLIARGDKLLKLIALKLAKFRLRKSSPSLCQYIYFADFIFNLV